MCLASSEVNDIGDGSPPQPLVGGSNGTSNDTDTCGCSAALSACVGSAQCTTAFACISAAVENGTCSSFVDCASCTSSLNGFDSSLLGNYTECIVCTALQALNSTANATTWAPYTTLNATDVPSTTINATADYGNCSFCASGCNRNEDCYFALKCFFSGGGRCWRRGGGGAAGGAHSAFADGWRLGTSALWRPPFLPLFCTPAHPLLHPLTAHP